MISRAFIPLLLLATICTAGRGQAHSPPPPPPLRGPTPLLFVQFRGPQGMQATFYQGNPQGRTYDAPVAVGLRPGYSFRVKLANLPKHPDSALYPTIQVCGTLTLPPKASAHAYPVNAT